MEKLAEKINQYYEKPHIELVREHSSENDLNSIFEKIDTFLIEGGIDPKEKYPLVKLSSIADYLQEDLPNAYFSVHSEIVYSGKKWLIKGKDIIKELAKTKKQIENILNQNASKAKELTAVIENDRSLDESYKSISDTDYYIKKILKYPRLTHDEELGLGRIIKHSPKKSQKYIDAKNRLIESNLRLVVKIAKKYSPFYNSSLIDLIQEGTKGLITAAKKFNYAREYRFSTPAVWWIRSAILRYIIEDKTIKMPMNVYDAAREYDKVFNTFKEKYGREPKDEELTGLLKYPSRIKNVKRYRGIHILNLDPEPDGIKNPMENLTDSKPGYDFVLEDSVLSILKKYLNERELKVIILRYGLFGRYEHTLDEASKEIRGITKNYRNHILTKESVRIIEKKTLKKLRSKKCMEELKQIL